MLLERIKALCVGESITLAELEKRTNISNGTIGRWDKSVPRVDKLLKVADYFSVSLDYLVRGEKENPHYQDSSAEKYAAFIEVLDLLSPDDRRLLLEKAQSLVNLQKVRDDLLKF